MDELEGFMSEMANLIVHHKFMQCDSCHKPTASYKVPTSKTTLTGSLNRLCIH